MIDVVHPMSNLSGLDPATVHEIWAQVKANHARLNACPDHHFERTPESTEFKAHYRCRNCEGEIDAITHRWYTVGRSHGTNAALARPVKLLA